jgi:hypothetical protein
LAYIGSLADGGGDDTRVLKPVGVETSPPEVDFGHSASLATLRYSRKPTWTVTLVFLGYALRANPT